MGFEDVKDPPGNTDPGHGRRLAVKATVGFEIR